MLKRYDQGATMIETGNIYEFKEHCGIRYALVLKPEAHPGFARVVLASDKDFKTITCRMNLPIERFNKTALIGKMGEEELAERIRQARKRSSDLDTYLGKPVAVTFTDNSEVIGVLNYIPEFSAQYGYQRPGYVIGTTSFLKSHVKHVKVNPGTSHE